MLTKEESFKLIRSIGKRDERVKKDIQTACLSAVYYSICHGDSTIAAELVKVVGAHRKPAVVNFLEAYGQLAWDKENATMKYQRVEDLFQTYHEDKEASQEYCDAIDETWEEFNIPPVRSKYDCEAKVISMLSTMQKKVEGGKAEHPEVLEYLMAAMEQYQKDKTAEIADLMQKAA